MNNKQSSVDKTKQLVELNSQEMSDEYCGNSCDQIGVWPSDTGNLYKRVPKRGFCTGQLGIYKGGDFWNGSVVYHQMNNGWMFLPGEEKANLAS